MNDMPEMPESISLVSSKKELPEPSMKDRCPSCKKESYIDGSRPEIVNYSCCHCGEYFSTLMPVIPGRPLPVWARRYHLPAPTDEVES